MWFALFPNSSFTAKPSAEERSSDLYVPTPNHHNICSLSNQQDFTWHSATCEKNILKNSINLSLASSLLRKYRQIHLLPRLYFHYFIMKMRQNCILFIWIADEFHLQKENPHFLKPYELFLKKLNPWFPLFTYAS